MIVIKKLILIISVAVKFDLWKKYLIQLLLDYRSC